MPRKSRKSKSHSKSPKNRCRKIHKKGSKKRRVCLDAQQSRRRCRDKYPALSPELKRCLAKSRSYYRCKRNYNKNSVGLDNCLYNYDKRYRFPNLQPYLRSRSRSPVAGLFSNPFSSSPMAPPAPKSPVPMAPPAPMSPGPRLAPRRSPGLSPDVLAARKAALRKSKRNVGISPDALQEQQLRLKRTSPGKSPVQRAEEQRRAEEDQGLLGLGIMGL